jgi:hypothetical protein
VSRKIVKIYPSESRVMKDDEEVVVCPLKRIGEFKEHECALKMDERTRE